MLVAITFSLTICEEKKDEEEQLNIYDEKEQIADIKFNFNDLHQFIMYVLKRKKCPNNQRKDNYGICQRGKNKDKFLSFFLFYIN